MKMRLLHAALTLTLWGGCAREPVVSLELRAVPTEAATLEVWTWVDQVGVKSPTLFPIAAPQETLRLGLRLGQERSALPTGEEVRLGIGAFSKEGCLLALAESRGILAGGADLYLRESLVKTDGPCGEARPIITSVTPTQKQTLTQELMVVRGLGFQPGMTVRVGADEVPRVIAKSPLRLEGLLPTMPGRVGPKAVTVVSAQGSVVGTAQAALQLILTKLHFQSHVANIDRLRMDYTTGWMTPVAGAEGHTGLLITNYLFSRAQVGFKPAAILTGLAPGATPQAVYFPADGGRVKFVTALDLDGKNGRDEVVLLVNNFDDTKMPATEQGARLLTYRIAGYTLSLIDQQQVSATGRFGFEGGGVVSAQRQGVVRPAQPGSARETLLFTLDDALYEYSLAETGSLTKHPGSLTIPSGPRPLDLAALYPDMPAGLLNSGYLFSPRPGAPFEAKTRGAAGCTDLATGDLNGDKLPDLACSTGKLSVFMNRTRKGAPEITMETSQLLDCGAVPRGVALGDLDGDGLSEIACGAAANQNGMAKLYLYLNKGGEMEPVPLTSPPGEELSGVSVVMADFDGDGRTDLAAPYPTGGALIVFNLSE